jgi:hypothetical protein
MIAKHQQVQAGRSFEAKQSVKEECVYVLEKETRLQERFFC